MALGQMDVTSGSLRKNLDRVKEWTAIAAQEGADLIVFPELWSNGYDLSQAAEYATEQHKGIFSEVVSLARDHRISIVGSCLAESSDGKIANEAVYLDASGHIRGAYSKTHLFRLMQEKLYLAPEDQLTLVVTGWGLAGLAIC